MGGTTRSLGIPAGTHSTESVVAPPPTPPPLTVDGGEHGCDEILVEVAVLAHLKHLLPFRCAEARLHLLHCHVIPPGLDRTKLHGQGWEGEERGREGEEGEVEREDEEGRDREHRWMWGGRRQGRGVKRVSQSVYL